MSPRCREREGGSDLLSRDRAISQLGGLSLGRDEELRRLNCNQSPVFLAYHSNSKCIRCITVL